MPLGLKVTAKLYLDSWTFVLTGHAIQKDTADASTQAVREFASNWTNKDFVDFVDELRSIVDSLAIDVGGSDVQGVLNRVVELEIEFWPQFGEEKV